MAKFLIAVLFIFSLFGLAIGLQVVVPAASDECFSTYIDQSNKLMGSFEVLAGGSLDIDALVYGPSKEVHYSVVRLKTGTFNIIASVSGYYKFCLSNKMSSMSAKTVAFSLHAGDALYKDVAKQEHIDPLEQEITQLADAITMVEDEQHYMTARERASRRTNESTNKRVLWYSILEAVIMISFGLWQIFYLRSFFEKRRAF